MSPINLPRVGLGTYSDDNREQWIENVETGIEVGYRHIDTAQGYDNEQYVGEGIARADVDRDELFVVTKVDPGSLAYDDVLESVDESLERLGLEYLDLLYIHWPIDTYEPETTLQAFQELSDRDVIRHIGLSNFEPDQLDHAGEILDAPVAANQVECHPLLPQTELRRYAREHDQWLVAYCPLAQGEVFDVLELREIGEKHDVTAAQVSLAWLLSKENVAVIPKASSEAHMSENLAAQKLDLDDEDIARIDAIDREHRVIDPDFGPWNR